MLECVLCGDEIDEEDGIDYVEMPTISNVHNGSYYSTDVRKQYRPICKYEFDNPNGYIYVFNKGLKENPTEFLYKQGIVVNNNANNDDGITLKEVENACDIAESDKKEKVGTLKMIKYIIVGSMDDKPQRVIDIIKNKWKDEELYLLIRYNDDEDRYMQFYVKKNKESEFKEKVIKELLNFGVIDEK
jgi:hypothetical protein